MMSIDSFLVLQIVSLLASFCYSVRIIEFKVPAVIDVRDKAIFVCKYDLEGDIFLSLKWYKEDLEFYRYRTDIFPRKATFQVEGVSVVEDKSNVSMIMISPLEYKSSGLYRCEVSGDAPLFNVASQNGTMNVLGLPKEDPKIEGVQTTYSVGSYVTANCTSSPSHPPARMDWFINGAKAQHWLLDYYYTEKPENVLDLETRTIGLKFQTDSSHFQRNDGTLSLVCSATVADHTRKREIKAYLSKLTKVKFAQYTNYSGKNAVVYFFIVMGILLQLGL